MTTLTPTEQRRALARKLANACPPDFASEIAITGSTARGMADADSDLEMNFWRVDSIPELDVRLDWLTKLGATKTNYIGEHDDNSDWIECEIDGIPCEIGFQTFDALETAINQMLEGEWHETALADVIVRATSLRSSGWLEGEQTRLAAYSDAAQRSQFIIALRHLIENNPSTLQRWVERGARLALIDFLVADLEQTVRLIFALNRRWMPSRKWALYDLYQLPTLPAKLFSSINGAFRGTERESVERCSRFVRATLKLLPSTDDELNAIIANVRTNWGG